MPLELSALNAVVIAGAGLLAGIVNAFAGGGTLISYTVLIWLGVPPVTANISSSVGLLPSYAGAAAAYRPELRQARPLISRLVVAALLGGMTGALLLLAIPERSFELVVPPLIGMGVVLLAFQPRIASWVASRRGATPGRDVPWSLFVAVLICGAYGSFFGAGLGVLLLAALGAFLTAGIQIDNALKALLSFVCVGAGVVIFIIAGGVAWAAALLLLVGSYLGGWVGGKGDATPPSAGATCQHRGTWHPRRRGPCCSYLLGGHGWKSPHAPTHRATRFGASKPLALPLASRGACRECLFTPDPRCRGRIARPRPRR